MRQKLIVISMDALIYEDLEYLKTKKNFKWLMEHGSIVKKMRSIYPTLTYPCHTTMSTGCYPDKHGILNNTENTVGDINPRWLFDHKHVLCSDILDVCKAAGYTTAAVGWPVTGNHPNVDFLIDECWPDTGSDAQAYRKAYISTGTPPDLFDAVVAPHLELRIGRKQPQSSYFLTNVCVDLIRKYKPDVLIMHQGNVDSFRHKTGVFSPLVTQGLDQCDDMLGRIIDATKEAGVFEQTNFIVTADHGHMDCDRTVHINTLLADAGLIDVDAEGKVKDWRAYCFPTGMSAQIYLKDPSDTVLYKSVHTLLTELRDSGSCGISEVFTKEQVQKEHLSGDFSFIVETDGRTGFGTDWTKPALRPYSAKGGNHGYHPDRAPSPPLLAFGPNIRSGLILERGNLVDGAPTYAAIMGTFIPNADGRILNELISQE